MLLLQQFDLLQVHSSDDLVAGEILENVGLAGRNHVKNQVIVGLGDRVYGCGGASVTCNRIRSSELTRRAGLACGINGFEPAHVAVPVAADPANAINVGRVLDEAVHDEGVRSAERRITERTRLLQVGDAVFILGGVVGQEKGAAWADQPENLLNAGARAGGEVDTHASVLKHRIGTSGIDGGVGDWGSINHGVISAAGDMATPVSGDYADRVLAAQGTAVISARTESITARKCGIAGKCAALSFGASQADQPGVSTQNANVIGVYHVINEIHGANAVIEAARATTAAWREQ